MKANMVILTVLLLGGIAYGERTIWYVHPDSALNTIQAALDSCANGDIVLVGPGTYVENVVLSNKGGIHLISEIGPEATMIDGNDAGTVLWLSGPIIDTTTIIRGFTIQNGHGGYNWEGGGIHCCNGASPKIVNNIIQNNVADSTGGGIYCSQGSDAIIEDNIITGNTSVWGGGISLYVASPVIKRNEVRTNNGLRYGGGIYAYASADPIIDSCTVFDNYAYYGGPGIFAYWACSLTILNTTVTESRTTDNGAIEIMTNCYANITGSTISNNNPRVGGVVCVDNCALSMRQCNVTDHDYFGIWFGSGSTGSVNYCNISNNNGYGMINQTSSVLIDAEYNWWGDSTGPYHPDSNPGGLGDTVSDYVDFIPWIGQTWIAESPPIINAYTPGYPVPTIFRGPLHLPKDKSCRVFDITGRVVEPATIKPGVYFVEIDGIITEKIIKVR